MWPFSKKQNNVVARPVQQRSFFNAAALGRLTNDWATSSNSIDWDLRNSLPVLRARSRKEAQNNDYAAKFLQMVATHVVGPNGFNYQVRVKDINADGTERLDTLDSKAIEDAFWRWMRPGNCDVTGKLSFFDVQRMFIETVARDGEGLARKVYSNAGPFGFKLQLLDTDRLDTDHNETLANNNVIKMGVETTPFGQPVAYWLRVTHPGESPLYTYSGTKKYERVPADQIYHLFVSKRPEQSRGIPWMAPALMRMHNLRGYEEAAIVAARVGAAKMGFYVAPDGDGTPLANDQDPTGKLISDAEAGVLEVLPAGYSFEKFDPDYPHAMFDAFVKTTLRGVASGLGVAYNTISNDLEGVNFSSIRTGVLEERDNWMVIQNWMIEQFLDDVFSTWLKFALLNKAISLPNGSALPASKFDKFNACTWQGRRWQWVDPQADINANVIAINNGLKSRADVIAEQGKDMDDTFASLKVEQDKLQDLGIQVAGPNPNQQTAQPAKDNNQQGGDGAKK